MGVLAKLAGLTLLIAIALAIGLWAFQKWGVYRFDEVDETPEALGLEGVRKATFQAQDGTPLEAWIAVPRDARPVVIAFHGNFTSIGASVARLTPLREKGYGLAMLRYRGAGGAAGRPSEAALKADALALYDQLDALMGARIPPERRVIHGFSLGSGLAAPLAAERPAAALVIEAGFASLCDYFTDKFKGAPFCWLMWTERYDSIGVIDRVAAPVLIAHGARDHAIPLDSARKLFAAAPEPKRFLPYPEGGHSNLPAQGFLDDLDEYLSEFARGG